MASSPQPSGEDVPTPEQDIQQAELFAASAAEGALTDRKAVPSLSEELNQLALHTETKTSSDHSEIEQSPTPTATSHEPGSDTTEQPDRVLTKEELVEEALNCPCIASMREGPCGDSFISAYKCFLESETEPKGMDCVEQFKGMQSCMADHPEEYNLDDDEDGDTDPFAAQNSRDSQQTSSAPTSTSSDNPDSNSGAQSASASS